MLPKAKSDTLGITLGNVKDEANGDTVDTL